MPKAADELGLSELMRRLADERPVFHSEADFQFALTWAIKQRLLARRVRLEVPQGGREYLDLLVEGPRGTTAIELKYFTAAWAGKDPRTEESFHLRSHSADDLLRLHFIHDVTRFERFAARLGSDANGIAIVLSNHPALWKPPSRTRPTRDAAFRIHEGVTLAKRLVWGTGDYPANDRELIGTYPLSWQDYATR